LTEADKHSDSAIAQQSTSSPTLYWRLLALLGMLLLAAFVLAPFFCQASEDAIILFQYSANLARTGVISYIPHGPRAEGATDFLWMVYLAAGRWMGIPSYGMAIASSATCVVLLAALLVKIAQRRVNGWNLFAVATLLLLAPQTFAAEAGFSVFAFALFLGSMTCAAYFERYGLAAIAGLLLCLVRPDGVVFASPLLAIYLFRGEGFAARWWKALCGFVLPGLIYFVWRWRYFGHLLPLPFYVKSDTKRIAHVLVLHSAVGLAPPLLAACLLIWIALRKEVFVRKNLVLAVSLLVPSSSFYLAMRLDQNYANRFFFYPLVIAAVLLAVNFESFRTHAHGVLFAGLGVWILLLAYFWINWFVIYTFEYPQPRVVAVAQELEKIPGRGSMIVSESGAIPFYSGWAAYDPWGLNTPDFALHLIQPQDVAQLNPDLVIVHQDLDPLPCLIRVGETLPHADRSWQNMNQNVIAGIDPTKYAQWLLPQYNEYYRSHPKRWNGETRWGVDDYQCWFVRREASQSIAVQQILLRHGAITAADYMKLHP
jgi:hypothetical protein